MWLEIELELLGDSPKRGDLASFGSSIDDLLCQVGPERTRDLLREVPQDKRTLVLVAARTWDHLPIEEVRRMSPGRAHIDYGGDPPCGLTLERFVSALWREQRHGERLD